jgi:hypothetical protein
MAVGLGAALAAVGAVMLWMRTRDSSQGVSHKKSKAGSTSGKGASDSSRRTRGANGSVRGSSAETVDNDEEDDEFKASGAMRGENSPEDTACDDLLNGAYMRGSQYVVFFILTSCCRACLCHSCTFASCFYVCGLGGYGARRLQTYVLGCQDDLLQPGAERG